MTIINETERQKRWELYCSSVSVRLFSGDDRSFDDWENGTSKEHVKSLNENELKEEKEKSIEILKNISPKQNGR